MVLTTLQDYFSNMIGLTPLNTCLAQALDGTLPVPAENLALSGAGGFVVASDLQLAQDLPPVAEALRAGFAVAALDLVGASVGNPVALLSSVPVVPGAVLPTGTDAVVTDANIDRTDGLQEAIHSINPGEGVRRTGHDGRKGQVIVPAGQRLTARHLWLAGLAGMPELAVRRPRVAVCMHDATHARFVRSWVHGLGAVVVEGASHLSIRTSTDHHPRLAVMPAETAWLHRDDKGLVLTLPARFDGMLAALLALGLPAIAALTGAMAQTETRPLKRKVTSTVGLSELVLLAEDSGAWLPQPAGTITLSALAASRAFAILPPDCEGLPAGAPLVAIPLDLPFG